MFKLNLNIKYADVLFTEIIKNNDDLRIGECQNDVYGNKYVCIKNDYIYLGHNDKLKCLLDTGGKERLISIVSDVFRNGSRYTTVETKRGYILFDVWCANKYLDHGGNIKDEYKFLEKEERITENKLNKVTIKLTLDTTEFEEGLNRIEKRLERIKDLEDVLMFDKELNEVKKIIKGE